MPGLNPNQEASTDRVPCKPSTKARLNDMLAGMGSVRATYDQLLNVLMDAVAGIGESDYHVGRRLAPNLLETPSPDDPKWNRGRPRLEAEAPSVSAGD